jgi:hypothetical protein
MHLGMVATPVILATRVSRQEVVVEGQRGQS